MNKTVVAASLFALFASISSLASVRLDDACKGRIVYDLGQKGYDVRSIKLKGIDEGYCDNEICNPDVLQLIVTARDNTGALVTLAVDASTRARGEPESASCRVYNSRIVKRAF